MPSKVTGEQLSHFWATIGRHMIAEEESLSATVHEIKVEVSPTYEVKIGEQCFGTVSKSRSKGQDRFLATLPFSATRVTEYPTLQEAVEFLLATAGAIEAASSASQ